MLQPSHSPWCGMFPCRSLLLGLGIMAGVSLESGANRPREYILHAAEIPLRTGAYSPFASFQELLAEKLVRCGKSDEAAVFITERRSGLFGAGTTAALQAAESCGVPADEDGALTLDVWRSVAGNLPVPDLQERAGVMVLTFEATDFGQPPEWNLCQDGFELRSGQSPLCINHTDPCSFLTWGPRGATAGQGREIQRILWKLLQVYPKLVEEAFGAEVENVRRFVSLAAPPPEDCDGRTPLEHFMCAIWMNEPRRNLWTDALTRLGRDQQVRQVFNAVYALEAFDGYKLRAYYQLWNSLDLLPSEIDYAFFLDRATHIGGPPEAIAQHLDACVKGETLSQTRNAAARRCLSRLHPHPTQPVDRLGRDVSFYRESYPRSGLSETENARWQHHIPISAEENLGLSDDRAVPLESVLAPFAEDEQPAFNGASLTEAELSCPASILSPVRTISTTPP